MRISMVQTCGRFALAAVVAILCVPGQTLVMADDPDEQAIVVIVSDDESEDSDDAQDNQEAKLWLGVMLKLVEGDLARYVGEEGILVDSVFPDSPAAEAGIEEGDILLSVGDTELLEPLTLVNVMRSLAADDDQKSLEITILRKGEKKELEVTPSVRPEMDALHLKAKVDLGLTKELNNESIDALLKSVGKGKAAKAMNVFRFGNPSMVWNNANTSGDLDVVIKKNVDGDKIQVTVTRTDDEPAKISVKRGDDVQEYSEENMDEMDDAVADIVKSIVIGNGNLRFSFGGKGAGKDAIENSLYWLGNNLDQEETYKRLAEKYQASALELSERASVLAKEAAAKARKSTERVRDSVRKAAKMPAEMEELRSLVEELRAEVQELRSKLTEED